MSQPFYGLWKFQTPLIIGSLQSAFAFIGVSRHLDDSRSPYHIATLAGPLFPVVIMGSVLGFTIGMESTLSHARD